MVDDRRTSLGCGTLILIALIVLIFGNQNRDSGNAEVLKELKKLQRQVSSLSDAVDQQKAEMSLLREQIEKLSQRQ